MRRNIFASHTNLYPRNEISLRCLRSFICATQTWMFFIFKKEWNWKITICAFLLQDRGCHLSLYRGNENTCCLSFCCSIIIKLLACWLVLSTFCHVEKCYLLSWDLTHVFCLFPPLPSTICLFIALAQDMVFYVAVILSFWHIPFLFVVLENSYVALFTR